VKIDVHNHVFPRTVMDLVAVDDRFGVTIENNVVSRPIYGSHEIFAEQYDTKANLAELERRGLEGAVISVEPALFLYHDPVELAETMADAVNAGMAQMTADSGGRFRWLASLPLQDPERGAQVLRQAVADGAVGAEIGSNIAGNRLDEPEYEPFWNAVEETNSFLFVHSAYNAKNPGLEKYHFQNVIGNLLETTICAERLVASGTLDRHPNVKIMLGHAGGYFPYQAGRFRHARTVREELANSPADPWAYCGRLMFDTITHDVQALRYLISRVGADNVLVGTDIPFDMSTPEPWRELTEAVDEKAAKHIAEENPARLFGF
jgi:aminocarboxymuconate-semialdehyde decarboxylase